MAFLKDNALQRLMAADARDKLGHAYLITGPVDAGKEELAVELAAHLLQTTPLRVSGHPDYFTLKPESKSRRIVVDQIRELESGLRRKSQESGRKVAIIHDAERLQPAAANAFLKTLEEPPPQTHLLLLSSLPESMLETVLSRCIKLPLRRVAGPGGVVPPSEREQRVLSALDSLLQHPEKRSVGSIYQFVRCFQEILAAAREEIADEFEEALDREKAHYKNTTDSGWIEGREEQTKAQTEAATVRERQRLLQVVANAIGRQLNAVAAAASPEDRVTRRQLIRQIEAVERLRSDLERNVNEALALEAGFLEIFLPLENSSSK